MSRKLVGSLHNMNNIKKEKKKKKTVPTPIARGKDVNTSDLKQGNNPYQHFHQSHLLDRGN